MFTSKYEAFILNLEPLMWKQLCLKPLNLYMEPVDLHLKCGTFVWRLRDVEPFKFVNFLWNLEELEPFVWNLCGTWNIYVEPSCGTSGMWCEVSGRCPKPPRSLLEKTQAFQAVGEKNVWLVGRVLMFQQPRNRVLVSNHVLQYIHVFSPLRTLA